MENIFEGTKFGDKFVCTNNKVGILVCCCEITGTVLLMFADNYETYFDYSIKTYRLDGICVSSRIKYDEFDIVSRYHESIDENKLDEFADKLNPNNPHGDNYEVGQYFGFQDGFKAGYRKAIEE